MAKRGKLFVVSAPSGSGKTTLCRRLLSLRSFSANKRRRLVRSVSATTRAPRKNERQGRDYFFLSKEEFLQRKRAGAFLEWARVLGNYYGTPRKFVQDAISQGRDVLLSIDVQGALKIKRMLERTAHWKKSGAVFIFILPPSWEELSRRLRKRSTEKRGQIDRRLNLAKEEINFIHEYNYAIINDRIDESVAKLKEIIDCERKK